MKATLYMVNLHLVPFLLLFLDQTDMRMKWKPQVIFYMLGLSVLYFVEIWYYSTRNNKWAYPLLDNMNMAYRLLFFAISMSLALAFYILLLMMNGMSQGSHRSIVIHNVCSN